MQTIRTVIKLFCGSLLLSSLNSQYSTALAQGTAFTYQGRLNDGANPANGIYDFTFSLFGVSSGGSAIAGPVTNSAVGVTNGLFITTLDFGPNFPGADRWLEIGTSSNATGAFTALIPRQKITPAPYAVTASNVTGIVSAGGLSGTYTGAVTLNNAGNSFTGNGGGLTALNASQLSSGTVPNGVLGNAWKTAGNAGTSPGINFLGTTDNQPLELKVNGQRALRLEPNSTGAPNVIGGSPFNQVDSGIVGSTIGGGATNYPNRVAADFGTIGGGEGNTIQTNSSDSFIGGGSFNTIATDSESSVIVGGYGNTIQTDAYLCIIGGGDQNTVQADNHDATIGGGENNVIQTNAVFSTIGGGNGNVIRTGASSSTIAGGADNTVEINAYFSTIGGGEVNTIQTNANSSAIAGGSGNTIQRGALGSTIAGGQENTIQTNSTIAGGRLNTVLAGAGHATIGGGFQNTNDSSLSSTIAGGYRNNVEIGCIDTTIAGGEGNTIRSYAHSSTIGGGEYNTILTEAWYGTVPGGDNNSATNNAFPAGHRAKARHDGAFVWADSTDADFASTGANQFLIRASGGVGIGTAAPESDMHIFRASAGTVTANTSSLLTLENDNNAFIHMLAPSNAVSGILFGTPLNSLDASVRYNNSGDRELSFRTLNSTRMAITTNGFVGIGTIAPTNKLHVAGGVSATAFVNTSDRNAKENFQPVNPRAVLEKVAALPIMTWTYKEMRDGRHMGPVAQDFHAAFGLGGSDKTITTIDPDGVALAAIQGLDQKVEEKEARIAILEKELAELKKLILNLTQKETEKKS